MGQQQLLLLVLGIVLVGLAVVVGIQVFSENSRKAALDDAAARVAGYAGIATGWRMSPAALGGGLGEADSRNLGLSAFGVSADHLIVDDPDYEAGEIAPGIAVAIWRRTGVASGPTVEVWDMAHGLKSALFLYGTTPQCQVYRHATSSGARPAQWEDFYASTSTLWEYSPEDIVPAPAGCVW